MDLEQESIIAIDTGMSNDIAISCNKLIDTQKQLKTLDDQRTKLEEVERTLSEQTIPNLMQQAGFMMLKLADGSSVEITKKYAARIPTSKIDEAHDWLRDNGYEDLIKNDLSLSFGMKEDNQAKALAQELIEKGFNVKQKTHVHHSTLSGFVKEQIEDGKDIPHDLFGVFVADRTKIITKE